MLPSEQQPLDTCSVGVWQINAAPLTDVRTGVPAYRRCVVTTTQPWAPACGKGTHIGSIATPLAVKPGSIGWAQVTAMAGGSDLTYCKSEPPAIAEAWAEPMLPGLTASGVASTPAHSLTMYNSCAEVSCVLC